MLFVAKSQLLPHYQLPWLVQAKVADRNKALEELVQVRHFCLQRSCLCPVPCALEPPVPR